MMTVRTRLDPFPGLRPFRYEESHLFFGRGEQVDELLTLLRTARLVAVIGASGSGKSSLVRAGLLPALHGGFATGIGSHWSMATMRPGAWPVAELARALAQLDPPAAANDPYRSAQIEARLRRSSLGLADIAQGRSEGSRLLVVVDQFEEVFRFGQHAAGAGNNEVTAFVRLLTEATRVANAPVDVILTMRSDYLGDCSMFADLPEAISSGLYLVPRLTRQQMARAITGPVAVAGASVTPRLLQRVLNDAGDDPDVLPVLQHAMMRTWQAWRLSDSQREIDLPDYEVTGGIAKALSRHAEQTLEDLPEPSREPALPDPTVVVEKAFRRLTEIGPDGREGRRPTSICELAEVAETEQWQARMLMEHFAQPGRSFVTIDSSDIVDISHESLIREWDRLRDWAERESESRETYERLADSAARYERGQAALLSNPDLGVAQSWWRTEQPNAAWATRYGAGFADVAAYLGASSEAEHRRKRRRRMGVLALAIVAVVMAGIAALALAAQNHAERVARHSRASELAVASLEIGTRKPELSTLLAFESVLAELGEASADSAIDALDAGEDLSTRVSAAMRSLVDLPWSRTLRHHTHELDSAHYSPDGRWIATASKDTTAAVWTAEGDLATVVSGHEEALTSLGWNTTSDLLVTASDDQTARVWDIEGHEIAELVGHTGTVWDAQFSPDGEYVVTVSLDGTARMWSPDGTPGPILTGHSDAVRSIAFSPDSSLFATGGDDGTVIVWNRNGSTHLTIVAHEGGVADVEFSPDAHWLMTGGEDAMVRLWSTTDGAPGPLLEGHTDRLQAVRFSPDGEKIATTSNDRTARIWTIEGESLAVLHGHTRSVWDVDFSPTGERLVTASIDGSAALWSIDGTRLEVLSAHTSQLNNAEFSPDGSRVLTASDDRTARIWHLDRSQARELAGHSDRVLAAAFNADGSLIATASRDGTGRVWYADGSFVPLFGHEGAVRSTAFNTSDDLVVTTGVDRTVRLWSIPNGVEVAQMLEQDSGGDAVAVRAAEFGPDGSLLAIARDDGVAAIRRLDGSLVAYLGEDAELSHADVVRSASFSPAGDLVVTASHDGTAKVWDVTGRLVSDLVGHDDFVVDAAFDPTGTLIVTAGNDWTARVWTVDGQLQATLRGHRGRLSTAEFSPAGDRVITSSFDGTVRVWDTDGVMLSTLTAHPAGVRAASFSPDERNILTAGQDHLAKVWAIASHADLLRAIASRLEGIQIERPDCIQYELDRQPYCAGS